MANITGSFLTPTGLNSSINSTLSSIILKGKDIQNEPRSRLLNFSPVILFSALLVAIVIGNMLVLYCLQRIKEVGAITKIFLRNLAVTDLGVGCFCIPTSLASSFHRGLSKKQWFCDLNGAAMIIFLFASILTLSSISVQKYSSVGNRLQSFFTKRVARAFIATIWTISTIFAVGPIIGWSFYKTSEGGFQCGPFAWTISGRVYSACLFIVGMLTPVAVMIFCYLKIFINISVYIGRKRTDTCDPSRDKELQRRATSACSKDKELQRRAASACSRDKEFQRLATIESRLLHTLFIMAISFAICWTPCMVLVIIEFAQLADPLEFEVFALACAYASSAVNPIIYTLRHESFRRSFKRVIISSFRGIFCRARCYTHKEAIDIMGLDTMRRNRRIAVITGDENDLFQENAPREAFAE
eukprot:Seg1875.2 transcript_id=Seg1875.2/GoldUCD/mRNA.D3Y31 product="Beta-1 adrenergic receptor" protein_id=Seg1875.2/GoldUCD/D3Y31